MWKLKYSWLKLLFGKVTTTVRTEVLASNWISGLDQWSNFPDLSKRVDEKFPQSEVVSLNGKTNGKPELLQLNESDH